MYQPDRLLADFLEPVQAAAGDGPVIDLACGAGHNGLFLASRGLRVTLADRDGDALERAEETSRGNGLRVTTWKVDLELEGVNPLEGLSFSGIIVFRYLHRPLVPHIRRALKPGGILVYETFTSDQAAFGRPRNPAHLLRHGELQGWFQDWQIIHYFEGITGSPARAVAQLVCKKPG